MELWYSLKTLLNNKSKGPRGTLACDLTIRPWQGLSLAVRCQVKHIHLLLSDNQSILSDDVCSNLSVKGPSGQSGENSARITPTLFLKWFGKPILQLN